MTHEVCIDANLAVMCYTPEENRECAVNLLRECYRTETRIIAPDCIFFEATSAVRRKVYRKLLIDDEGFLAISLICRMPIDCTPVVRLYTEAWELARKYNLSTLYDAYYLALAELRGCDFWTADERFINSVQGLSYVKNIKDFTPGILES